MTHSPEYEREVISTLRLVRLVMQLALLGIGITLVLGVLGAVFGLVTGGHESTSRGGDVHAPLRPGSSISNTTEAGQKVSARIKTVAWEQGPVVTASVAASSGSTVRLDNWYLYLDDNTRLPMVGQRLGADEYRFALEGALPAGKNVRFVHFNPDDSHGDIYFDVN